MLPSELHMVKRFRRSAAGYDEQLPSDIRTPATLRKTLDYLIDDVVGSLERLAVVHKFVWDRTRAIRNDFSIQQVTKEEDVKIAVECYERIARFHIYSLHHFSNPDNLNEGEEFNSFQEKEQLQKTLLSLLYYYNDNAGTMQFPNEAEFRAYCIIREMQTFTPDIEDQLQTLPMAVLQNPRVQTALMLYNVTGNTIQDQGPLQPYIPFSLAQNQPASFWTLLQGRTISYTMACVAETYFPYIRLAALDALWRSVKKAPVGQQARTKDWTVDAVTYFLGFDEIEQATGFCSAFELTFSKNEQGELYLDFTAKEESYLDKSLLPSGQIFSQQYVEDKRFCRTIPAVMNGIGTAEAVRSHAVEAPTTESTSLEASPQTQIVDQQAVESEEQENSMFFPDSSSFGVQDNPKKNSSTSSFNPAANPFSPFGQKPASTPQASAFPEVLTAAADSISPQSPLFGQGKFSNPSGPSVFGQQLPPGNNNSTTSPFGPGLFANKKPSPERDFTFGNWQRKGETGAPAQTPSSSTSPALAPTAPPTVQTPMSTFTFGNAPASNVATEQKPFTGFSFAKTSTTAGRDSTVEPSPTTALSTPLTSSEQKPTSAPFSFPTFTTPNSIATPVVIPTAQQPPSSPGSAPPKPVFIFGQQPPLSQPPSNAKQEPFSIKQAYSITPPASPANVSSPKSQPPVFTFQAQAKPDPPATPLPPTAPLSTPAAPAIFPSIGTLTKAKADAVGSSAPLEQTILPSKPKFDKADIITHAARLAILQRSPRGFMQQFVDFKLGDILQEVMDQHTTEVRQTTMNRLKRKYLMRKYFPVWRQIAWRHYLDRKAKKRRHAFAESLRMEANEKRKKEDELEEILRTAAESRRIEEAIRKSQLDKARKDAEDNREVIARLQQNQLAGTKRKGLGDQAREEEDARSSRTHMHHKRSKTMGSSIMAPPPRPSHNSPLSLTPSKRSIFTPTTFTTSLGRSKSAREMRASQAQSRPKIDNTKTDFFRLVAHGMDPNTPFVPLTASQVKLKAQKEQEQRQVTLDKVYNRRRLSPNRSPSTSEQPSPPLEARVAAPSPSPAPSSASSFTEEQEDLLREAREAREAMAKDTHWFEEHAAAMKQETEQEEQLKSSTSSQQSVRVAVNGLSMADVYECNSSVKAPRTSMSRVEQRIRARGLAYIPLGGPKSNYRPVAMSRRSALRYSQNSKDVEGIEANGTAKKRRKRGHMDTSHQPTPDDAEDDQEDESELEPPRKTKAIKHKSPAPPAKVPSGPISSSNPYDSLLQGLGDDEDDEDDEGKEGYLEDDQDSGYPQLPYQNSTDADTEELDEDSLFDEDSAQEDNDEVDHDEEASMNDIGHHDYLRLQSQPYEDAPTPGTEKSGVSSGIGATQDDAIELSD